MLELMNVLYFSEKLLLVVLVDEIPEISKRDQNTQSLFGSFFLTINKRKVC